MPQGDAPAPAAPAPGEAFPPPEKRARVPTLGGARKALACGDRRTAALILLMAACSSVEVLALIAATTLGLACATAKGWFSPSTEAPAARIALPWPQENQPALAKLPADGLLGVIPAVDRHSIPLVAPTGAPSAR